jgi:hypothetical protein
VVPPPPPLPRSPAIIQEQEGIGAPQAIRKANAERAAWETATGLPHPRDKRGELEAILGDPRSNAEIEAELNAPRQIALQQATENLPLGFKIAQDGGAWTLTDPAGNVQTRVEAHLPSPEASEQMAQLAAQLAGTFDYSEHNRVGDGTRENPVVVQQPSDIAAAAANVAPQPTPAQVEAGNHQMGHVNVGGLQISIETPAGAQRSGTGPDGTPWSVTQPADYGYVKGTEGADGDHHDVYLGPETHQAANLPVYVIDQKDAHSWAFDEHKAMLGFPSQEAAVTAYHAAFSDGYGPQRLGAITPMSFDQFKVWLKTGKFARPKPGGLGLEQIGAKGKALAYKPPPVSTPQARRKVFNRPMSLLEFIAASGGIREQGGELANMGLTRKFIPKFGALVRKNGNSFDRARELAQEAGYLPAESNFGPPQIGISELLNLMEREARGEKVFTPEDEAELLAAEKARQQEAEQARYKEARKEVTEIIAAHGIKLTAAQQKEVAIDLLGGRDIRDALLDVVVRAALEEDAKAAEAAEPGSDWDIPFGWETDNAGELADSAPPIEGGEPAGTGSEPAGQPAEGVVQPAGGDGAVQAAAGGGTEAVSGDGEPAAGPEPSEGAGATAADRGSAEATGGSTVQAGPARPDDGSIASTAGAEADLAPKRIRTVQQIQAEDGVGAKQAARIQEQEILARGRPIVESQEARRPPLPPAQGAPLFGEVAKPPAPKREPEPLIKNDKRQIDMFGTGDAAVQAQAARDQAGRGALAAKGQQAKADEGLFAQQEAPQPELPMERRIVPEAFKALAANVFKMTGHRVQIDPSGDLQGKDGGPAIAGLNTGGVLITVALQGPEGTAWTLNHEAVHSLHSFGLIRPAEWRALEAAADQRGWAVRYKTAERYSDQPEAMQKTEAIADAFADFMANRQPTPAGMIEPSVARSKTFLGNLKTDLNAAGFEAPEDIFERIASGEVGEREPEPKAGEVASSVETARASRLARYREIGKGLDLGPYKIEDTLFRLTNTGEVDPDVGDEVMQSLAAIGPQPPTGQPTPNAVPVAGGVMTTVVEHLTNFERVVDGMVDPGKFPSMSPMAHTSVSAEARALAKAFANGRRKVRWAGNRLIDELTKDFTPEQRTRMWEAADAESVAQQTSGASHPGVGLSTLSTEERTAVENLQRLAGIVFRQARMVGIHDADPLPSYVPRMVVNIGMQDERTHVVRDIRTLALATMRLQEAIWGRRLIQNIKAAGQRTGGQTVFVGAIPGRAMNPLTGIRTSTPQMLRRENLTVEGTETGAREIPGDDGMGWFTIPESAAFWTWRWAGRDEEGGDKFEKVPIQVRGDFKGALRAVMRGPDGKVYRALMDLKGRMMTSIMYGVAHLAVISGRTLAYSPNVIGLIREGRQVRQDVTIMSRAIDNGLVPIGKKAGFQDAEGLDPQRELRPGNSWTAQIIGAVPAMFSRGAGDATKRAIDKAGDVVHNKLLWDRVADIQAGIFARFEREFLRDGQPPESAATQAAHFANRAAGALPQEAMAEWVHKAANILLFSRSYRLGNLGMVKDAILGLPRDMQATLLRTLGPAGLGRANAKARRFAISVLVVDLALLQLGNSFIESSIRVIRQDKTIPQELHGYLDRLEKEMKHIENQGPILGTLDAINMFGVLKSLTPMSEHEPGKENRILLGYEKDGTGVYLRNPFGKAIEDLSDYFTQPLQTFKNMLSPYGHALFGLTGRDTGDKLIWDPYAHTSLQVLEALGDYVKYVFAGAGPQTAITAAKKLATGQGGTFQAAQIIGGGLGMSISHGYPGGPVRGEIHAQQQEHQFQMDRQITEVMRLVKTGKPEDMKAATDMMTKLGMKPQQMRAIIIQAKMPHATVKQIQDIMRYATPEERGILNERMQQQQERRTAP